MLLAYLSLIRWRAGVGLSLQGGTQRTFRGSGFDDIEA